MTDLHKRARPIFNGLFHRFFGRELRQSKHSVRFYRAQCDLLLAATYRLRPALEALLLDIAPYSPAAALLMTLLFDYCPVVAFAFNMCVQDDNVPPEIRFVLFYYFITFLLSIKLTVTFLRVELFAQFHAFFNKLFALQLRKNYRLATVQKALTFWYDCVYF